MTLTDRQRRFVEAYLLEPNATKAAIAAGYSAKNADVTGPRLLGHVGVAAALDMRRRQMVAATGITPERVLAELAKLGFSDIRAVVQLHTGDRDRPRRLFRNVQVVAAFDAHSRPSRPSWPSARPIVSVARVEFDRPTSNYRSP